MGIYVVFPEEREPNDALSEIDELVEKAGGLHIHGNAFIHFSNSMINERLKILSTMEKENPELYKTLLNRKLTPEEINKLSAPSHFDAFKKIMDDWSEIVTAVEMLHDTDRYLNKLPDAKENNISRYFRYHMSNHLNEFFILYERMDNLIETTQRLYGKDVRFHKFSKHFDSLKSVPVENFKEIRRERNIHVHEKRYTDYGIEELEAMEFDIGHKISDPEVVNPLYLKRIEIYKMFALQRTEGINTEVRSMVDLFFGILERFLFSDQDVFIPPTESRKGHK
jgi:hypothetical protein